MCFASSIIEAHKKLFIAPEVEARDRDSATPSTSSRRISASKMSRSKSRLQTEVCGDCGATGELMFTLRTVKTTTILTI